MRWGWGWGWGGSVCVGGAINSSSSLVSHTFPDWSADGVWGSWIVIGKKQVVDSGVENQGWGRKGKKGRKGRKGEERENHALRKYEKDGALGCSKLGLGMGC